MENDYIVTTPSENDTHGLVNYSWKELYAAPFAFNLPFCLRLSDNQFFLSEQVVRLVPKRRMVVFGTWHGKPVVAKLFFDIKQAKRHLEKDVAGIKALQKNKIPTPELLYEGKTADRRVYVLLFERIVGSISLKEIWEQKKRIGNVLPLLKSVIIEIATQHVLGLLQHDLHLKNFLLTEKMVYTLDGAQIKLFPKLISKKISINNLALFLSQLGIDAERLQETLFRYYAEARGWPLKPADLLELFILIRKWNDVRWKKFSKKILRASSDFSCIKHWGKTGVYQREYEGPEFNQFLKDPDSVFSHRTAKMLKAGNSATVIRATLDQRELVIKRYNMKSVWHRLRRCFRPTRADASWRIAQKLNLFKIATAKPVAFIEYKIFGLRGTSYYVTEYVSGEHIGDFLMRHWNRNDTVTEMIRRISILLKSIAKVEISHGDLKINNILVDADYQPVLIDLDGAAEHLALGGLRKTWRKEINRFLENFSNNPAIRKQFEMELGFEKK